MPEYPDIEVYLRALDERVTGKTLRKIRIASPFVLRSYEPPVRTAEGRVVTGLRRIGKRVVFDLEGDLFLVIHLMVAGRLRYKAKGAKLPKRLGLLALDFDDASIVLTEASKKKRASFYVVQGEAALAEHDRGGIEVLPSTLTAFRTALQRENHTVKRNMTDPRVFSGIGNSYSDEILHRAQISPIKWTSRLTKEETKRLHKCCKTVLREWTKRLDKERKGGWPEKVTAFRPEMAVHGKHKQPCPVCQAPVQRIVRGESEFNYCPGCQTGGKLLADRALSRLLKKDWPRTLDQLEDRLTSQRLPEDERKSTPGSDPAASGKSAPPGSKRQRTDAFGRPKGKRPARRSNQRGRTARKKRGKPTLLFAHGAGLASDSPWMLGWAERLAAIGSVSRFDYPYMQAGRKLPDRHDKLLEAHLQALRKVRLGKRSPSVLIGKSMGSRIGCHVSLEQDVDALVCFGYPLVGAGKSKPVRDQVLVDLQTPILFIQGTRDKLCPLEKLAEVRARMQAASRLHVVETGDHSLLVTKTWLKQNESTQDAVDARIAEAVAGFLAEVC